MAESPSGDQAAVLLWNEIHGRWIVRVSEMSRKALPFWRKTVQEYTGGEFSEIKHSGGAHGWDVFAFETATS